MSDLSELARWLRTLGETAEAVPVLERAIALAESIPSGDSRELHMQLALALQALGNLDGAHNHAERALFIVSTEHQDDRPRANHLLAYALILRDEGRLTDAKRAARKSLELEANAPLMRRRPGEPLERHVLLAQPDET